MKMPFLRPMELVELIDTLTKDLALAKTFIVNETSGNIRADVHQLYADINTTRRVVGLHLLKPPSEYGAPDDDV